MDVMVEKITSIRDKEDSKIETWAVYINSHLPVVPREKVVISVRCSRSQGLLVKMVGRC